MIRWIFSIIIVLVNIILQATVVQNLAIGGTTLNLLLITVVSFALIRGKFEGAAIGLSIGFMQDLFYGGSIGFYALLYMYIGYLCGFFNKTFYRDNILIPMGIIAAADTLINFSVYIMTFLFRGRTQLDYYYMNIILPEVVFTTFVSIFIYKLYLFLNDVIEQKEKEGYDANDDDN